MKNYSSQSFHLVDYSPWPILASVSSFNMMTSLISWFSYQSPLCLMMNLILVILLSMSWWRDIAREGSYQGTHSNPVYQGLKMGMILFIVSEVLFFFSFFWTFLHSSLNVSEELGFIWPCEGVMFLNPLSVPLLNTLLLLSSGVTVTWCHMSILECKKKESLISLLATCMLGSLFLSVQSLEYYEVSFSMSDSVFGSIFFVATGFHGLHVLVGTVMLVASWVRLLSSHFNQTRHFGFEAAAWYWHFVDVVWLFLYILVYWWGQ